MIDTVVLWSNGMVMVFDTEGNQVSDYQGRFLAVRDKILADAPATAKFKIGHWPNDVVPTSRECFGCETWEARWAGADA